MMLLEQLSQAHHALLESVANLPSDDFRKQYHADLSPLGWHLGHVAYIGQYWLREVILGDDSRTAGLHDQFLPEQIEKTDRQDLPGIDDLPAIAASYQDTERLLESLQADTCNDHHLLDDHYIGWFLLQHAEQHLETLHMALQQRQIRMNKGELPVAQIGPEHCLSPDTTVQPVCVVEEGVYPMGCSAAVAYDNECPPVDVRLKGFRIASSPVSNAQYLAFMHDDGYQRQNFWSGAGWQWKQRHAISAPQHWHGKQDCWFQYSPYGPASLDPEAAVNGIGWYEAEAFARYADCRLPHESEWEAAMSSQPALWSSVGGSWEWCANTLFPYQGFRAFPYERYSQPWFDDRHCVMRGAGPYTSESVRRPSFRNFYTADKRYAFSGLRLAKDL